MAEVSNAANETGQIGFDEDEWIVLAPCVLSQTRLGLFSLESHVDGNATMGR